MEGDATVITYFHNNAKRLSAAGVGQERPVADNRSEEGRAKNRRVELVRK